MKRHIVVVPKNSLVRVKIMFIRFENKAFLLVLLIGLSITSFAKNRIDTQRPDAPDLAAYGQYAIGVKTLKIIKLSTN